MTYIQASRQMPIMCSLNTILNEVDIEDDIVVV